MNAGNKSEAKDWMLNILLELQKGNFDSERALKIEDLYGSWGATYVFHVGIYLWPIQILVTAIMFVIFRRRKLLGVTQKFIILIMTIDLCFTLTSVIRDILLRVFRLDYGFVEYRVCPEVMFTLRLQMVFHATSVWLNTLMSLHHFILVGYPLKVRTFNLSAFFFTFIVTHLVVCCTVFLFLMSNDYQTIPLIQKYIRGHPLKRIEGCVVHIKDMFGEYGHYSWNLLTAYVMLSYAQLIPCCLHVISWVSLVIFLQKHIRAISVLTNSASVRRVKYLRLMAINIGLGLSFFLQEAPVILVTFLQFAFHEGESTHQGNYSSHQGVITSVISVSYSIGKPLNLLIYASLSTTFKQDLKGLLLKICCLCGSKAIQTKEQNQSKPIQEKKVEGSQNSQPLYTVMTQNTSCSEKMMS